MGSPAFRGACGRLCKCPYSSEQRTNTSGMALPRMRITAVQPSKQHCLKRRPMMSGQPSSPHPYRNQWKKEAKSTSCKSAGCLKTWDVRLRRNAANSWLKRAGCKLSGTEPPHRAKTSLLGLITVSMQPEPHPSRTRSHACARIPNPNPLAVPISV